MGKKKGKKKGGKKGPPKKSEVEKTIEALIGPDQSVAEQTITQLVKRGVLQDIDALPDVSLEQFIGVENAIASQYPNTFNTDLDDVKVDDGKGGTKYSEQFAQMRSFQQQQNPTLAQVRRFCTEWGVLPLGSAYIRENNPDFVSPSMLLYGPSGSGKTMLARAIAKSVGARWFDLSPGNIIREGVSAADVKKIVEDTVAVAAFLQPSVIYIDEFEKMCTGGGKAKKGKKKKAKKKVSASGDAKPSHILSELSTQKDWIMKQVEKKKDCRILIIGNTSNPTHEDVDQGTLKSFFLSTDQDKTPGSTMSMACYIPYPNHYSRTKLWDAFIRSTGMDPVELATNPDFSLNTLAFISEGYTAGSIKRCVTEVLNQRRIGKYKQLNQKLTNDEFVKVLSQQPFVYKHMHKEMQDFTTDITGRMKYLTLVEKMNENEGDGGKDKKGGKKKKG